MQTTWTKTNAGLSFANDGNFLAVCGQRGEWVWQVRPSGVAGAQIVIAQGTVSRKIDAQLAAEAASQAARATSRMAA